MIESLERRRLMSVTLEDGVIRIIGTAGVDIVGVRAGIDSSVIVHLNGQEQSFDPTDVKSIFVDTGDGNDRIDISGTIFGGTVRGGAGKDKIVGPPLSLLDGGGGNDQIFATVEGRCTLVGGRGNDYLFVPVGEIAVAQFSSDSAPEPFTIDAPCTMYGGAGNDTLTGAGGSDYLSGDAGDDLLNGLYRSDRLVGGPGNDRLSDTNSANAFLGGSGNDTMTGSSASDTVLGGPGNDTYQMVVTG